MDERFDRKRLPTPYAPRPASQVGLCVLAHNGLALIRALASPRAPPKAMITQAIDTG